MNPFQFKIPSRKRKCLACADSFEDGSLIVSIIKGDEESPEREDYCHNCFQRIPNLTQNIWGHWESLLKRPKEKLTLDQRAMELFTQKHTCEEREWVYFLAHYLKRKKQLHLRSEIKKEGALFFEDPLTSQIYSIADVTISAKTLLHLKGSFIKALEDQTDPEPQK